jgi:hypothetical protein
LEQLPSAVVEAAMNSSPPAHEVTVTGAHCAWSIVSL